MLAVGLSSRFHPGIHLQRYVQCQRPCGQTPLAMSAVGLPPGFYPGILLCKLGLMLLGRGLTERR